MSYLIAEIGFNHEGEIKLARKMIEQAANAGANAVKFQTFRASDIVLPTSTDYGLIECGQMDLVTHIELAMTASDNGIDFMSTPYSPWAVELLEEVGVSAYKIASMDCINRYLLRHIAQTSKPIYLSTGMATLSEIADSLEYLRSEGSGPVTLLHCLSLYPPKAEHLNLTTIGLLKKIFGIPVGYSDHYPGTKACLAAIMMGAEILEVHFTLDSSKEGGDHFHSVEPDQLRQLVSDISLFDTMRGQEYAIFNRSDRQYAKDYRRGLYSARTLAAGEILKEEDFLLCRPTSEFSPGDVDRLKGKVLDRDVFENEAFEKTMLNLADYSRKI